MKVAYYLWRDDEYFARRFGLLAGHELSAPPGIAPGRCRLIPKDVDIPRLDEIPKFSLPLIEERNRGDDDRDAIVGSLRIRKMR